MNRTLQNILETDAFPKDQYEKLAGVFPSWYKGSISNFFKYIKNDIDLDLDNGKIYTANRKVTIYDVSFIDSRNQYHKGYIISRKSKIGPDGYIMITFESSDQDFAREGKMLYADYCVGSRDSTIDFTTIQVTNVKASIKKFETQNKVTVKDLKVNEVQASVFQLSLSYNLDNKSHEVDVLYKMVLPNTTINFIIYDISYNSCSFMTMKQELFSDIHEPYQDISERDLNYLEGTLNNFKHICNQIEGGYFDNWLDPLWLDSTSNNVHLDKEVGRNIVYNKLKQDFGIFSSNHLLHLCSDIGSILDGTEVYNDNHKKIITDDVFEVKYVSDNIKRFLKISNAKDFFNMLFSSKDIDEMVSNNSNKTITRDAIITKVISILENILKQTNKKEYLSVIRYLNMECIKVLSECKAMIPSNFDSKITAKHPILQVMIDDVIKQLKRI